MIADIVTINAVAAAPDVSLPLQQPSLDTDCVQNQPQVSLGSELEAKGRYFIPKMRSKLVPLEEEIQKLRGENEEMGKDLLRLKAENEQMRLEILLMKDRIRDKEELTGEIKMLELSNLPLEKQSNAGQVASPPPLPFELFGFAQIKRYNLLLRIFI